MDHYTRKVAQDFTSADDSDHFDRICDNIDAIGYEYWFTQDSITHYRHPATQHIAEVVCH